MGFDHYLIALIAILLPLFIYFLFFYDHHFETGDSIIFGWICIGSIILSMSFPLELSTGHIFDLRTIPWLLAFLYGGMRMGILATVILLAYRFFIGVSIGYLNVVISYGVSTIIILLFLKNYKKFHLEKKLLSSLLMTVVNVTIIITGTLFYNHLFDHQMLSNFYTYFFLSHVVTILLTVFLIEMLIEKEESKRKLQQTERVQLIGEMAASVAHEIRNPITVIKGFIQLFEKEKNITDSQKFSLQLMESELLRAEKIINDYLSLAKSKTGDIETLDIKEVVDHVTAIIQPYAYMQGVEVVNNINESTYIKANRNEINQVLLNIIKNGIEAIDGNGTITLSANQSKKHIEIQVSDSGVGMTSDEIDRLGTPFYSTKEKGTGLGTMVCYRIIENLDGEITVKSEKGKGTIFSIRIPVIT